MLEEPVPPVRNSATTGDPNNERTSTSFNLVDSTCPREFNRRGPPREGKLPAVRVEHGDKVDLEELEPPDVIDELVHALSRVDASSDFRQTGDLTCLLKEVEAIGIDTLNGRD